MPNDWRTRPKNKPFQTGILEPVTNGVTVFGKVFEWAKAHPLYAILIVAAVAFLIFAAANGIGKSIEAYRANRFDKAQAAKEQEIVGLKLQRDAAIKRADVAESKAILKESEATELRELIKTSGGKIEAAAKETDAKIEEAKRGAGTCADSIDPVACVCAKLKVLGFECN